MFDFDDFLITIGAKPDTASLAKAKAAVKDLEQAVVASERRMDQARLAGAKTAEQAAQITAEIDLKEKRRALDAARDVERQQQAAAKKQAESLKQARERIEGFVKVAVGIGAAIEAAALGVHAGVVKMAQSFDTLNFTSQRTGVTVRNIQAIGFAASQMGSTVEAGVGSLENFARTLRQSPGSYSLLERLGVKTTDANGAKRSADALFQEIGKALKNKPGYLQDQYLQDFGIDEKTGRALIQGLDEFTKQYNEKLKATGLDPDKAAKDGAALQRTFGSLAASISIIGQKVASNLFSGENNAFQQFITFLDTHGDQIAAVISHIAEVVLELAKALLTLVTSPEAKKWFDQLLLAFGDFNKETGKFEANVDKMKLALGLFGTFVATTWLSKILGAFSGLGSGWKVLLAGLGLLATPAGAAIGIAGAGAVGADAAVPNAEKPGVMTRSDDENAGGNSGSALGNLARRAAGAVRRGAAAVGRAFTGGSAGASEGDGGYVGNDGRRAAGGRLTDGGKARIASWMEFLQRPVSEGGEGMSRGKAQAVIAGMQGESRLSLDPDAEGDHDRNKVPHAFGSAQWSDAKGNPRFPLLKKYAASQGKDWRDLQVQQQYHRMEMLGLPGAVSHRAAYDAIMGANSDEAALRAFIAKYENPQNHDLAYQIRVPFLNRLRRDADRPPATQTTSAPTGGDPDFFPNGAPRVLKPNSMKDAPGLTMQEAERRRAAAKRPVTMQDVFPQGLPGVFNGSLPSFTAPPVPASSSDNSRTTHITIKQGDVNVKGVDDGKRVADHIGAVQGYRNSDLIRNLRPSLA